MSEFDIRKINLNLLPTMVSLVEHKSVSAAARELGLSQSAVSHALGKLRELFDDPILARAGRRLLPTPRALQILERLGPALDGLQASLWGESAFDPGSSTARFTVATIDYFEFTAMHALLGRLRVEAPEVRLDVERLSDRTLLRLRDGQVDVVLGAGDGITPGGVRTVELYRDPFAVIARPDHPLVRQRLTLAAYLKCRHVVVRLGTGDVSVVDGHLHARGATREVGLRVPHFVAAPLAVAASDMICTVARGVALRARELFGLRVFSPPIELPAVPIRMAWSEIHAADRSRRWLRDLIASGRGAPPHIRSLMRAAAG